MKKVVLIIISLFICVSGLAESNGDSEYSMLVKHLWEIADNYVAENAELFISVIRKACPDIPEEAEVECSQGRCHISAEEVEEKRQLVFDVSLQNMEEIPENISNFISTGDHSTGDYTLNPKSYGVMIYKFTWKASDELGADKSSYKIIEQLYEINLDIQTFEISPVISYFVLQDGFTVDEENFTGETGKTQIQPGGHCRVDQPIQIWRPKQQGIPAADH